MRLIGRLVAIGCLIATVSISPAASAIAQVPDGFVPPVGAPAAVGEVAVEDPLTSPGIFPSGICTTGRNRSQYGPEGFAVSVTGKCSQESTTANVVVPMSGLTLSDGKYA
jgi:hypothetical protein